MNPVFIPTDFTLESLWPLQYVMDHYPDQPVNIMLGHMVSLPSSIPELLQSRRSELYRAVPESFCHAVGMIRQHFKDRIGSLQLKFIYGSTGRVLKHYLRGHDVNFVYMLSDHYYGRPLPQSIEYIDLLRKCPVQLYQVPLHSGLKAGFVGISDLLRPAVVQQKQVQSAIAVV